jgi:beta-lactamase regulating signal transducer with metallopeptidase domain
MIALLLKVTIVLALALVVASLARSGAASTRHLILVAAQAVVLLLPLLGFLVPRVHVENRAAQRVAQLDLPARFEPVPSAHVEAPPPANTVDLDFRLVWLAGAAAIASLRFLSRIRAAGIVRRATPFENVLISSEVEQPVTFGNRIVLPRDAESWDAERLDAVLLHERAHVERHDSLLALVGDAACALYWFHPLAWLTAQRAMLERERACDEAVLERGVSPGAYAGVIVEIARDVVRRRTFGMAMADHSHLSRRVEAILDPAMPRHAGLAARLSVIAGAIVMGPLLAALTPRAGEPDLLGDAITSPFSERIIIDEIPDVAAAGPDAAAIANLHLRARRPPQSDIDFVAFRARWALMQVRDGELVTPLLEKLGNSDWRIRAYAALGLAVARNPRATAALTELLGDRIWRVRAAASTALADTADPAAERAMRRALQDEAWQVRVEAVRYFAATTSDRKLFRKMRQDRHVAVRTAAEEALR